MRLLFGSIAGGLVPLLFAVAFIRTVNDTNLPNGTVERTPPVVLVGGVPVRVTIAVSLADRARGLGGRESLAEGEGMLFIFPDDAPHSFWMKDMRFPIDILWLSASGEVVDLRENVPPDSYPTVFRPRIAARYVLELPAGFCATHGVHIGSVAAL